VQTFPGHTSTRVRCLQFDDDKLVRLSCAHTSCLIPVTYLSSFSCSRHCAQAMGSFDQKCVRVLDFQTRRSLQELVGHTGGVMSLKFDRNILLSASRDRTVKSTLPPLCLSLKLVPASNAQYVRTQCGT
jgi:WD40 repeat protein